MMAICIFIAMIAVLAAIMMFCLSKKELQIKLEKVLSIYNYISILVVLINTTFVSALVWIILGLRNQAFLLTELFQIILIGALFFNSWGANIISRQVLMTDLMAENAPLKLTCRKYIQQLVQQKNTQVFYRPAIDLAPSNTPYFIALLSDYFVASTALDDQLAREPAWLNTLPPDSFSQIAVYMRNAAFLSVCIPTLILRIPEGIFFLLDAFIKAIYGLICAIAQSYDNSAMESFMLAYQAAEKYICLHNIFHRIIAKIATFSVDKIVRSISM